MYLRRQRHECPSDFDRGGQDHARIFGSAKARALLRLINALSDRRFTDWLPIYCTVIEHPEGLIVIDTGIPATPTIRLYFPPHIRLLQRAAPFQITPEQEIGAQMQARGLDPRDVRWVISTHLHQDHDGGMGCFPNAEFLIAREEWAAGAGIQGADERLFQLALVDNHAAAGRFHGRRVSEL